MKRIKCRMKSIGVLGVFLSNLAWAGLFSLEHLNTNKSDLNSFLNPRNGYSISDTLGMIEAYVFNGYRLYRDDVLNESVIDPRGVIWGEVVKEGDSFRRMLQPEAYSYCLNFNPPETRKKVNQALQKIKTDEGMKNALKAYRNSNRTSAEAVIQKYKELFNQHQKELIGAYFLPSAAHFLQLLIDNAHDFTYEPSSPYKTNPNITLPDLRKYIRFWSSSVDPENRHNAYFFMGNDGLLGVEVKSANIKFRCIRSLSAWE